MPYWVRGNAQQLFSVFGASDKLMGSADVADMIAQDMPRIPFLGTEIQENQYITLWKQAAASSYVPGNMSAGILQYLLGNEPLKKEKEDTEEYIQHYAAEHFAYLDEVNTPCGFVIMYRRDDPSQWALGLIRNTHLAPQDRDIILLSSTDLASQINNPEPGIVVSSEPLITEQLLWQLGCPIVHDLVSNIIDKTHSEINRQVGRINLLTRFLRPAQEEVTSSNAIDFSGSQFASLFADNRALDLLLHYHIHHDLHLSFTLLKDCLTENSLLRQEIEGIKFGDDERINQRLLRMTVVFYEEGTLEENRDLLVDRELIKRFRGFMWDKVQIKLFSFMHKKQYDEELMQFILAEEAYYNSVSRLEQLGLTQDVPLLFENPQKCAELKLIHALADDDCQQLCLIFWAKGSLTENEYKEIIAVAKEYPLMAAALVDLDKKGVVIGGINGLRALVLNPRAHLKRAIKHHFFKDDAEKFYIEGIKELSLIELKAASIALDVLRSAGIEERECYRGIVANNKGGQALRIFLPQLAGIRPRSQQKMLMNILYTGVNSGIPEQGNNVLAIKDKGVEELRARFICVSQMHHLDFPKEMISWATQELNKKAQCLHQFILQVEDLRARFICVSQMQDLEFPEEIIFWSAQEHNKRAQCFRKLILQVEIQYKAISEHLLKADTREMSKRWEINEAGYRKELYRIAYDAFISPKETAAVNLENAKAKIKSLEKTILETIDPPLNSDLYKALIIITNIVITILTVGIANYIKERNTGNPWFFTQTRSGEELRALTKNAIEIIQIEDNEPASGPPI